MKKIKVFFTALFALMSIAQAVAQTISVSGTVTDSSTGDVLPGAAIQLKGSATVYALTDGLGTYTIEVPADGVITVSCLGYLSQDVPVLGKKSINFSLVPDSQVLDDVIVVAYGTVRREANTGSVTSLKSDKLAESPASSVDKLLSGKAAGVSVSSLSGQPGSTTQIRVRGVSSIKAGNEPLWVVDGIPIIADDNRQISNIGVGGGTNTSFINPNDIESITILKDAAAASVYGSRAANGVILVTTKSGKTGQAKFNASVKYGAQQLANDNDYRPMTGLELVNYWRDAAVNGGYDPDDPSSAFYFPYSILQDGSHSWYKDLTRIGTLQEYEVNATGGNTRSSYYSSISYHKNEGVFNGVDFSRFSARLNSDYKLTDKLKSGARINVAYNDSNSGIYGSAFFANPAHAAYSLLPWTPTKDADGNFSQPAENYGINPLANAAYDEYNDKEYRFNGNIFLEWKPTSHLTLKTTNGAEASFISSREWDNPKADPDGQSNLTSVATKELRYTTSNTITYANLIGKNSIRILAGQEAMIDTYDYLGVDSPDVDSNIPYITTSTMAKDSGLYTFSQYSLLSFFGVADYSYADKYFLSASLRDDGSSLFGSKSKWGLFWSLSASWNIAKENFLADSSDWLSELKLRASYGVNGNNNIGAYNAYGLYTTVETNGVSTLVPESPENPYLSWEKNKTWDLGLDFGLYDDRFTGTVDVYDRLTTDMLLDKKVPYTTGFGTRYMNTGSLENKGVEILLNADIIDTENLHWSIGGNIAFNRSKVLDLAGADFIECYDTDRYVRNNDQGSSAVRIVEGKSMYTFYLRDYAGVNPSTGEGLFWTEDGTLTSDRTKTRWIYAGSPEPKFNGGFDTEISWKGLSLSAYFDYTYGNKVLAPNWFTTDGEDTGNSNSASYILNYWKNPGDTGCYPIPIAGGNNVWYTGMSTRFLEDGSYLRLKDVTLSYTLPKNIVENIKLGGVKVYVSALNAYTFHHVHAIDPELGSMGYAYGGNYPMVKSFIGGLEVTF